MAQIKTNLQYGVTGTIPTANIADDAITSAKLADDSVVAAAIADNAVVTAAINADAITAAKVADDIINSEHIAAGGIDTEHIADDQITLAKMAAGTDGNLIGFDASGNPAAIATGTAGQVLTSGGANVASAMADAAGGGAFTKITTLTASNSGNLSFGNNFITSTYERYLFLFKKLRPAVDNGAVEIEHSVDNGSNNVTGTTDYVHHMQYNGQNSTEYYHLSGNAQSSAWLTNGNIGSGFYEGYDGEMWFSRDNSKFSNATTTIVATNSNNCMVWDGAYSVYSGGINFMRFKFSNGNITSGSITLYGVEN